MKSAYVQALLQVLHAGMPVETALTGLKKTLDKKNHTKLYVPVLLEVVRVLNTDAYSTAATVAVATASDRKHYAAKIEAALAQLGAHKAVAVKEVVDETLIGGFVATFDYKERDQSYKKALKSLYESITK